MDCPICGSATLADAKFCSQCGAPLNLKPCPACDALNDRAATVCVRCAAAFPAPIARESAPSPTAATPADGHDATGPQRGNLPGAAPAEDYRALLQSLQAEISHLTDKNNPPGSGAPPAAGQVPVKPPLPPREAAAPPRAAMRKPAGRGPAKRPVRDWNRLFDLTTHARIWSLLAAILLAGWLGVGLFKYYRWSKANPPRLIAPESRNEIPPASTPGWSDSNHSAPPPGGS